MSIANIKEYTESFGIFDEPVEYNGVKLYPILFEDAFEFNNRVDILDIKKNELKDIEIIQMSYLMFLLSMFEIDSSILESFLWIMGKVFHMQYNEDLRIQNFPPNSLLYKQADDNETKVLIINGWELAFEITGKKAVFIVGNCKFNSTEFDELRKIILYQNLNSYDDTVMSEDYKRIMQQYYTAKNKGIELPTLEDKMLAILTSSGETRESIKKIPYRQVDRLFDKLIDKVEYTARMPLVPHLKNPNVEHWIYKQEKNGYDRIFSDADAVAKKVAG